MPFTLADIDFLASDVGRQLLNRLADKDLSDAHTLSLLTRLRKSVSPQQAGVLLETARLRQKAVDKFGDDAAQMLFTRDGLEQASDPLVRHYRSQAMRGLQVVDACCGIGADSLAMARAGAAVTGLDIDPVRIAIAQYNATALNTNVSFAVADVRETMPATDRIFFDPARRTTDGRRIHDIERYQPPLSLLREWHVPVIAKLSPGINLEHLANYHAGLEFISVHGALKEAVLWRGTDFTGTKATLLTGDGVHHWQADRPTYVETTAPRAWLVEPDPAILRAGLVQDVAAVHHGTLLDETIAYFTTDTQPDSVWLRTWQILDWMPFNLKKLRAYLRHHNIGHVTIKKRGFAMMPDELIPKLKLKGSESRTLVTTRHHGQPIVIVCCDATIS